MRRGEHETHWSQIIFFFGFFLKFTFEINLLTFLALNIYSVYYIYFSFKCKLIKIQYTYENAKYTLRDTLTGSWRSSWFTKEKQKKYVSKKGCWVLYKIVETSLVILNTLSFVTLNEIIWYFAAYQFLISLSSTIKQNL